MTSLLPWKKQSLIDREREHRAAAVSTLFWADEDDSVTAGYAMTMISGEDDNEDE